MLPRKIDIAGILLFSVLWLFSGCNGDENQRQKEGKSLTKQELLEINKRKMRVEDIQIDKFIERRGWNAKKSETGLRYDIYEQGDTTQPKPVPGQTVFINYRVYLINGEEIYTNEGGKPAKFVVDHHEAERGLHEGIRHMHPGAKAHLILPSYLAHGLTGDFNKIPSDATVIFDIELVKVE